MFRPSVRGAAVACVFALSVSAAHPAAFLMRQGEGAVTVSGYQTSGDEYYDQAGGLKSRGRFRKQEAQVFLEYGLTAALTLIAAAPYQRISVRAPKDGREGLGRSEFGVRTKLGEIGGWIVSTQSSMLVAGARHGRGPALIGETDDQIDVRGLVARSFDLFGASAFVDVQAGYRFRTADPADEVRIDATLGWRLYPRLLLLAQSFNQIGVARWEGPIPLKQRIHKIQGALLFDLTEEVSVFGAAFGMPRGRDALDERGGTVGVTYRF